MSDIARLKYCLNWLVKETLIILTSYAYSNGTLATFIRASTSLKAFCEHSNWQVKCFLRQQTVQTHDNS